jgi:hypothetical protein
MTNINPQDRTQARDVDDMEDIIDDLLMRKRSGKYIAWMLVKSGFGRLPVEPAPDGVPKHVERKTRWMQQRGAQ